jgi:hypothetical protein
MPEIRSITDPHTFGGMWKFDETVNRDTVAGIARTLVEANPANLSNVYVRGWDTQNDRPKLAICFIFRGSIPMRKYIWSVSDGLRRQMGNHLVGWDISSPITFIA